VSFPPACLLRDCILVLRSIPMLAGTGTAHEEVLGSGSSGLGVVSGVGLRRRAIRGAMRRSTTYGVVGIDCEGFEGRPVRKGMDGDGETCIGDGMGDGEGCSGRSGSRVSLVLDEDVS